MHSVSRSVCVLCILPKKVKHRSASAKSRGLAETNKKPQRESRVTLHTVVVTEANECENIYPIICLKSVDVRRLQVVILALSPRDMSQTNRILPSYILSRVRVSVRPRIFFTRKNRKPQSPAYFDPRCGDKQRNWKPQNRGNSVV